MKRDVDNGLAALPPNINTVRQSIDLSRNVRENRNGHRAKVIWLTGRPGAGKSTLANAAALTLHAIGIQTAILDGDNVRLGLCSDLGFSDDDRNENVRRVAETARLFIDSGIVVLVALVSPHREARENARLLIGSEDFVEVYCECDLSICEQRDPKGHYSRAKRGEIATFTGVSSRYEVPLSPELLLRTGLMSAIECTTSLTTLILERCKLNPDE